MVLWTCGIDKTWYCNEGYLQIKNLHDMNKNIFPCFFEMCICLTYVLILFINNNSNSNNNSQ